MGRPVRVIRIVQPVILVVLPAIMLLWAWLKLPSAALVTSVCACAGLVPFFVGFEKSRRRARDLMPVVILTALAVAGRLVFAPVPAIKPIIALVVMGGLCFGREEGFMVGALAMLVSNVFFGQGPWTPWQMFSMGLVGYLAGVLGSHGWLVRRWSVAVFGAAMALLYGFILDTWTIVGFVSNANAASVLTTYATGLATNAASAIGTVAFLLPIAHSWPRIFGRIKERYLT